MDRPLSQIILFIVFSLFVKSVLGYSCGTCDPDACEPPQDCLAGVVKDSCDCCYVCGLKEGERCDHADLNLDGFGKCGDNLNCVVRNDLEREDPPEAVCSCVSQNPLCGSDGVTYENQCQLTEARYRRRDGLRAVSAEPCVKPPKIVSAPQNIMALNGSQVSMTCEAKAWPAPTIQWLHSKDDTVIELPGNISHVAVQSRNGPGADEITSWLLLPRVTKEDEGTYVCKAQNNVGSNSASANITILS